MTTLDGPMTTLALCPHCVHYRMRATPELFSAGDMHSAGGLKARVEWEQRQVQLRLTEQQRAEDGEVLPYEPHFYPWCAAATPFDQNLLAAVDDALAAGEAPSPELSANIREAARKSRDAAADLIARAKKGDYEAITGLVEGGRATVNPVTGDVSQVYVLCRRINRTSQCPLFEARRA